jgi:hypothetical protein
VYELVKEKFDMDKKQENTDSLNVKVTNENLITRLEILINPDTIDTEL